MKAIRLTDFQLNEVQGILDICNDEVVSANYNDWEPEHTPWGTIEGNLVTINHPENAIGDLEDRAIYFIEETPRHTGCELSAQAASLSLHSLIQKIEGKA
jgi:hypothetical protein